jgi:hypothetical protein
VAESGVAATRLHDMVTGNPAKNVENCTAPPGDVGPVGEVSVTVAVQVEPWLTTTGVLQLTPVDVGRRRTDMSKKPELGRW